MKLFLVLIILLFEEPTGLLRGVHGFTKTKRKVHDVARPKTCFNNIAGFCKKKCPIGEIYEVPCLNGKLCCVNEGANRKYLEDHKPPPHTKLPEENLDYIVLPTVTVLTIQP